MAPRIEPKDESADVSLKVGISSCLLGEHVRWDAGHKRDTFLVDVLGPYVTWVPVCPEFEAGMGVPREPVHLVRTGDGLQMRGVKSETDWTAAMETWARRRVRELEKQDLCGFVLKKGSPSCGMERVKVFAPPAPPRREGRGLFASALLRRLSDLPVEEEGRLNDPVLRENFIERLFAYQRLRTLFAARWTVGRLVDFHARQKLQIMAHSPQAYRQLGRLVAEAKQHSREVVRETYVRDFMAALSLRATRGRQMNVLQHCAGYFRDRLDRRARAEVRGVLEEYERGLVPLVVPITLIRHYARLLDIEYLAEQTYLEPHPREMMLRNRV